MIYRFNNLEVDAGQFELRRDNNAIAIEPKVFDLILYLIKHRERIVSRDELFEQVWQGREVSDTSLSNHIKTARKALGDNGDLQQVIKTVRSRGYQFIADVEHEHETEHEHNKKNEHDSQSDSGYEPGFDASSQPKTAEARLDNHNKAPISATISNKSAKPIVWVGALFGVLFIALLVTVASFLSLPFFSEQQSQDPPLSQHQPYLLVVPFSVISNEPMAWTPFSDQITREIIQKLRKLSGLKVVPPPSSFTFKSNKVRAHIKEQLPTVTYLLDGVISEGTNGVVRISVELESLETGNLVWEGDFDIEPHAKKNNLFVIQQDIAQSVSNSLKVFMRDEEKVAIARKPTDNLAAYKQYTLGQHQVNLMTRESVLNSIDYYAQSITLDPSFEAPYIAKANAYRILMTLFDKPKDVLPKVISSALALLAINPESAQIKSSLGLAYVHSWLWRDAWEMLSDARKKDPSIALTELGFALYYSGLGEVGGIKRSLARADALDPLNDEIADWGTWALMMGGDIEAAKTWSDGKIKLHPHNPYLYVGAAIAHYIDGNFAESIRLATKSVALSQRESFPLIVLAQSYAAAGKFDAVRPLINEAQANPQYMCPYETAVVYLLLDDKDKAFELFNLAVEYQSNCLIFTRNDPRLEPIRNDARYVELLEKIGLGDDVIERHPK